MSTAADSDQQIVDETLQTLGFEGHGDDVYEAEQVQGPSWLRRNLSWSGLRRNLKRPKVLIPLIIILILIVALVWWLMHRSTATETTRIVTVSTGTIKQTVGATGTIAASSTEDLNFGSTGQVTKVWVKQGQKVKEGQKLAQIDSASLQSQVAQAQSSVASAQARLTSDEDAGASDAQINADEASLASANSQLDSAQTALDGATLTSPISGVVSAVNISAGQHVSGSGSSSSSSSSGSSGAAGAAAGGSSSGSSSSSSSTAAVQVISAGSYVVNLSVDDTSIANVHTGDQATITVSGRTDSVFGTVESVGVVATTSSGVASFPVVVRVTGSPTDLYAGSQAQVSIVYKQINDAILVSALAVHQGSSRSYVDLVSNGKVTQQPVTTGQSSGGQIQILSGLNEGDQVQVTIPAAVAGITSGTSGAEGTRGGGTGGFTRGGGGFPAGGFGGGIPAGGLPAGGPQ